MIGCAVLWDVLLFWFCVTLQYALLCYAVVLFYLVLRSLTVGTDVCLTFVSVVKMFWPRWCFQWLLLNSSVELMESGIWCVSQPTHVFVVYTEYIHYCWSGTIAVTIRAEQEGKQFLSPSSVVKITTGTEEKNENLSCFTTEVKMRFKKKTTQYFLW